MKIPKKAAIAVTVAIGFVGIAAVASAAPTITDTTPAPSSHTRDGRASQPCDWCHNVTVTPPPAPADTTAPITTISGAPAGWSNAPVTFSLTASDAGSGVKARYYRLGSGAQITYTAPVTISTDGATVVSYWSVDNAGNTETVKSTTVRVDRTAPVTSSNAAASYVGSASIALAATDAGSGVGTTSYRLNGGPQTVGTSVSVITPGTHTLEFFTTDVAGNAETPKSVTFTVTPQVTEPPVVVPPVIPTDTVPPVVVPPVVPTDTVPPVVVPPVVEPIDNGRIVLKRPEREGRSRWEIEGRLLGAPIADDDDDDGDEPRRRGIRNAVVRLEFAADGVTFAPTTFSAVTKGGGEFKLRLRNLPTGFYRVATVDGAVTSSSFELVSRTARERRMERDDD